MYGTAKHFSRRAALALLLLVGLVLLGRKGRAYAQKAAFEETLETSSDTYLERLNRIERQLRSLKVTNDRLQTKYDKISHQYEELLQRAADPVFNMSHENLGDMTVPNGLNLLTASILQKAERTRMQIDADGASEGIGIKRSPYEPEEEAERSEELPLLPTPTEPRRRQTGLSGAGEAIEPMTPSLMENYVNERGPYQPDMSPLGMPASVSFREGLQIRATDDFLTLEFHNLTQVDYRAFSQTGAALHDNFVIPRQRWYFDSGPMRGIGCSIG